MTAFMANDGESLSLGDIDLLVGEIERLRTHASKLESRIQELDRLVYRDTLVDVLNRRGLIASLQNLIARVDRYGDQAALLLGSKFCVNGACLPLSVAVGVGVIKTGDVPQTVIERADKAMYKIKAA